MQRQHGRGGVVWALVGVGLVLAVACGAANQAETSLTGANEVPPVTTAGTGTATAKLEGNALSVNGSFSGLQSDLFAIAGSPAHVHEADAGTSGPVVFPLNVDAGTDKRSGSFSGTKTLTDAERQAYLDGHMYVNVHSTMNQGGEVRGQLVPEK
ncbi:MAG: CHRD domain-containing protein [Myxococcaceae bacterium]|nr:CHRD domain-containing protein [Myxococcaceae bacterium]MCI0670728.1 CHRD domain-containing protein [Myxococcaceae bacterium]